MSDYERNLAEAERLVVKANSDENMGRIERAMYLTESNNHLLWALVSGLERGRS